MSNITVDWTGAVPQQLQTTQPMITGRFLEDTGFGWTGATSVTSRLNLVDEERLQNPIGNDQDFRGWIRMTSGADENLDVFRPVQSYDPDNGLLTVQTLPEYTAPGDSFEFWQTPIHPKSIINTLQRLTTQLGLNLPSYTFLSEIPDYDMEQEGTGAWSSTDATIAKVTWEDGVQGISGKQALSVTTTSAGGYVECQREIGVKPGTALWVSVQCTPSDPSVQNTMFMELWDVATNRLIDVVDTVAKRTVRLQAQMSTSGMTDRINIRCGSRESGVTAVFDELVLLDMNAMDVPLPYWMTTISSLKEVRIWNPANSGVGMNEYDPAFTGNITELWTPYADGFSGGGQLRLRSKRYMGQMLFVLGSRPETQWSSLTEKKHIDIPFASAALAVNVYNQIIGRFQGTAAELEPIEERRSYWTYRYETERKRVTIRPRSNDGDPTVWYLSK